MQPARVVVIEDEQAIRRGVSDALRASGYEAAEAGDGDRGLEEAVRAGVDLVLLDLMLPRRDGLDVLAEVRRTRPTLPVIILTARGSEDDRVRGLKMGADDYIVKPFSARELLARVEAVLRRSLGRRRPAEVHGARLGRAVIDLSRREIRWSEHERGELSEMETAILGFLIAHRKRAVSREELLIARLGHRADRPGDAHRGHAHRPAAHQAPRPVRPQDAGGHPHRPRPRLHGRPRPDAHGRPVPRASCTS